MDSEAFNKFDNDSDSSDEDYFLFVARLSDLTVAELRGARGNPEAQKQVLCLYYKLGLRANLSKGELIDFLAVSSPTILDLAEYTDEEGDALMRFSDGLTDEEIAKA